jgi:hypothetical protein
MADPTLPRDGTDFMTRELQFRPFRYVNTAIAFVVA